MTASLGTLDRCRTTLLACKAVWDTTYLVLSHVCLWRGERLLELNTDATKAHVDRFLELVHALPAEAVGFKITQVRGRSRDRRLSTPVTPLSLSLVRPAGPA